MAERPSGRELLLEGIERWNAGDFEALLEMVHPDVVWETSGLPGFDAVYRGRDGVSRFFAEFTEVWESIQMEPLEVRELEPGLLVCKVRFVARGREGIEVDVEFGQIYRIADDGQIWHFGGFLSFAEALAAAEEAGDDA